MVHTVEPEADQVPYVHVRQAAELAAANVEEYEPATHFAHTPNPTPDHVPAMQFVHAVLLEAP